MAAAVDLDQAVNNSQKAAQVRKKKFSRPGVSVFCVQGQGVLPKSSSSHQFAYLEGFRISFMSVHISRSKLFAIVFCALLCFTAPALVAQHNAPDLTQPQQYTMHKVSSNDPLGTNNDAVKLAGGAMLTLLDVDGPGTIAHTWFTISSNDPNHLKNLVLRMYWDGEATPSVETPIGDFFGLETGDYVDWESEYLSVGHQRALNSFFPMPFAKHARITITNEGSQPVSALYFSIEYMQHHKRLPPETLYFHAQYRQQSPASGTFNSWSGDGDARVNAVQNTTGKGNYEFLEAQGHGHFVGITLGILQNQDDWWGEGDEMFFIDGEDTPSWRGTGGEDYFLGAWGFGGAWGEGSPFSYQRYGAPQVQAWPRLPSRSPGRFAPPWSTGMPITAPTTGIRSLIGTRPSHTPPFPFCHLRRTVSRRCTWLVGLPTPVIPRSARSSSATRQRRSNQAAPWRTPHRVLAFQDVVRPSCASTAWLV
jgi:hypothetical protein